MSPPDAHKVAGALVCAPYVVGNLKEIKSDTPYENKDKSCIHCIIYTSVCVPQNVNIEYTNVPTL